MNAQALSLSLLLLASSAHGQSLAPAHEVIERLPAPQAAEPWVDPRTPVGPTTTPGDADSLYRIAKPGSYYLTGNLTGVAGKCGIEIASSDVTLDLMGFRLAGGADTTDGIRSVPGTLYQGVTVTNGSVTNWRGSGIDLSLAFYSTVERIWAKGNFADGIRVGSFTTLRDCKLEANRQNGVTAAVNGTLVECTAVSNLGHGYDCGTASSVTLCNAYGNVDIGIRVDADSRLDRCIANGNRIGIRFEGQHGSAEGCTANGNAEQGIYETGFGSLTRCTASNNREEGLMGFDTVFRECVAMNNQRDGILCWRAGRIVDCTAERNRGSGIYSMGANALIEGNRSLQNQTYGIYANGQDTIIMGNTSAHNLNGQGSAWGNFNVGAKCYLADVVHLSSGGGAISTNDSLANLSY